MRMGTIGWGCFVMSLCVLGEAALASSPATKESESGLQVQRALRLTSPEARQQRSRLLADALAADPENEAAHWHTGQVMHRGEWTDYHEIPADFAVDATIREYRILRSREDKTRVGQLRMADWCRDHRLPARERAHLTAALELSSNRDDAVLRARLGFQRIGGVWMTRTEMADQRRAMQAEMRAVKNWQARVASLVRKLDARRETVRESTIEELRRLRHPETIPILETGMLHQGLERERLLVELLSDFPSHKAADALARVGVFSNWDVVRKEAATELRSRPVETYAPELIRSLSTPINSRFSLYVGTGGVHLLQSHVYETLYKRQEVRSQSSLVLQPVVPGANFDATSAFFSLGERRLPRVINRREFERDSFNSSARRRNRAVVRRTATNGAIEAELQAHAAKRNAKLQNEVIGKWNNCVCSVLRTGTGRDLPIDAQKWWSWWYDYNQMEEEEKEYEVKRYGDVKTKTVPGIVECECLVAGTPVWTDRGFVAVEQVEVGDLVLSQRPATGELRYLPVLRTTIRDEEPVMEVTTAEGTIRATGGHTFWINGSGWTKLNQVKAGDTFHSVAGPVEILELKPAGEAKTYNMIVADDHTYFVGRARVLSHDVTFAEPVDTVIPGVTPQWE